jgi:hypothetical protein
MKYLRHISVFAFLFIITIILTTLPSSANGPNYWYVAPGGNDSNSCSTTTTQCATIDGAIGKAFSGDVIRVAIGTYTDSGSQVVLVNKNITITGGWNADYTAQTGMSTIDGEDTRRVMKVNSGLTATIERLYIQNGSSENAAGIYNEGTLTVNNCIVDSNADTGDWTSEGGGIRNASQTLTLNNSTVSNNTSSSGGGIFNAWGTLYLTNSTISGNSVSGGGGGINNLGGTATIKSSTISNNSADSVGGLHNEGGGTLTLQHSIVSGNSSAFGPDCHGTIGSSGFNLIGDTTNCTFSSTTGDLTNTDPLLGSLQDNGGPTYTHAITIGSPVMDAGKNALCPAVDQRGEARPTDGDGNGTATCDIGAYEAPAYTPTTPTNVKASNGTSGKHVKVTWTKTSITNKFWIYRADSEVGIKTLLGKTGALVFYDTTAVKGQLYHYWVKACFSSRCSAFSAFDTGWRKAISKYRSKANPDGWVLEKGEFSNSGGSKDSTQTTLRIGDDALDRQYCAILSFNTKTLPDTAVITSAELSLMRSTIVGDNPFGTHGSLWGAIRKGYFGTRIGLEKADFQAPASASMIVKITQIGSTAWYKGGLKTYSLKRISQTGTTQFRLCFTTDDNDNRSADYIAFFSGNFGTSTSRPKLMVTYYVP